MARLFLGIRPPAVVRKKVQRAVHSRVVGGGSKLHITPPKNWHITIHFIGDVTSVAAKKMVEQFRKASLPALDFMPAAELGGTKPVGRFGNEVLFLDVNDVHGHLQRMNEWGRELIPVTVSHARYRPHLTLARNPKNIPLEELVQFINQRPFLERFHPMELILFDSRKVDGKTLHQVLARRRFSVSKSDKRERAAPRQKGN